MSGTLSSSSKIDHYLEAALDLDQAGFKEAAVYLRRYTEVSSDVWAALEELRRMAENYQRDRDSALPPPLRYYCPPPPVQKPDIRADQIVSS